MVLVEHRVLRLDAVECGVVAGRFRGARDGGLDLHVALGFGHVALGLADFGHLGAGLVSLAVSQQHSVFLLHLHHGVFGGGDALVQVGNLGAFLELGQLALQVGTPFTLFVEHGFVA